MNINATIILQAINFGIAYLIFRFILLKPAYAAIVADNKKKAQLESLVADGKQAIERKQQQIAQQWQASYLFFKQHTPEQAPSLMVHRTPITLAPVVEPTTQQIVQMRHTLSDAIVSAIRERNESL
jgi:hypothetical protein